MAPRTYRATWYRIRAIKSAALTSCPYVFSFVFYVNPLDRESEGFTKDTNEKHIAHASAFFKIVAHKNHLVVNRVLPVIPVTCARA